MSNLLFYTLVTLFLTFSVYFEKLSRSEQLFYLHHLPKGTLTNPIKISNPSTSGIGITCNQSHFQILINGRHIFNITNIDQDNFMTIFKSVAKIQGNGDAFYDVSDQPQIICSQQRINRIQEESDSLVIYGDFSDCLESEYQIQIKYLGSKDRVEISAKLHDKKFNRILLKFADGEENQYFGLGEQFSNLNLKRNRPYSMLVREKGAGRGDIPQTPLLNFVHKVGGSYFSSYSPVPIWISSAKIAFILHSYAYSAWMNNQILVWDYSIKIQIVERDTFKLIVGEIAQINGYTPPVPDWVNNGAILGLQGGTQAVINKYNKIKQNKGVISGVWMQDWVSKRQSMGFSRLWWNWQIDHKHYQNWNQMSQMFNKQNVKTLIYVNPMFSNISSKQHYNRNFYEQGIKNSYFLKDRNKETFHISAFSDYLSAFIDFDSPDAKQFYKDIIRSALKETQASGMMVDFSEGYPISQSPLDLIDAIKAHNNYPNQYMQAVSEVFQEFQERQMFGFIRAGHLGTASKKFHLWAGDESMQFKKNTGLPSCLTAMLSSSLVGYSTTHCDIGGYIYYNTHGILTDSIRTPILMTRWFQLAAFSPVFRSHEGNNPQKVIQAYSDQIVHEFAFYSQVFSLLAAYRKEQGQISHKIKIPLVRPIFLQNQQPKEVFSIADQYYLGSDILVCPILTAKSMRKYFIPKGTWINIWNKQIVQGCDCFKQSSSFLPPVLIKQSSTWKQSILKGMEKLKEQFPKIMEQVISGQDL